tara:strand:- start:973 stop:1275 length:303 start_codon:yes stop_codon:yes gene_type:complete
MSTAVTFKHITDEVQNGVIGKQQYENGNLALRLWQDGMVYTNLSTNVAEIVLDKDCFIAKNYSENEGLIEQFIEMGIFEDTKERVAVGYVVCPILRYMPY